jgi:ribosomal protein L14E/L6E/L27E
MNNIFVGDVVKSVAGRDKGKFMLVIAVGERITVIDGKLRRVSTPKKKNPKHLIKVKNSALVELAEKIRNKQAVGNDRVKKALKTVL